MQIVTLEQSSPEWLAWRAVGIGSSDAPVLWYGQHFERNREDLLKEKVQALLGQNGHSSYPSKKRAGSAIGAMRRGHRMEPFGRSWYEDLMGVKAPPCCATHDTIPFLKASYDGWVAARKRVLEIKAPNKGDHECALNGQVPGKYLPQLLHLCLVAGPGSTAHYVSMSTSWKGAEAKALVVFTPSEAELKKLENLEVEFWAEVRAAACK